MKNEEPGERRSVSTPLESAGRDADDLSRRRDLARLAALVSDHAEQAIRSLGAMHDAGLSTGDALQEVWRSLPVNVSARVPEGQFVHSAGFIAVLGAALLQGEDAILDLQRQMESQIGGKPDLNASFLAGKDLGMQRSVLLSEAITARDRDQLCALVRRALKAAGPGLACRVILRSGRELGGTLSEMPNGLLAFQDDSFASTTEVSYRYVFAYEDLTSILLPFSPAGDDPKDCDKHADYTSEPLPSVRHVPEPDGGAA